MFDFKQKNQIMGILNVTPDSFSDGGQYTNIQQAVDHALEMEVMGADIIDIGGQSTRPGYQEVSSEEELARILPVVEALKQQVKIPISIDTYFPDVAEACILAGADIINDIKGMDHPGMAEMLAKYPQTGVIIMHSRKRRDLPLVEDIQDFYQEKIEECQKVGIDLSRICFDPGAGFHKEPEGNLAIMQDPNAFRYKDFPLLIGISRKRSIGTITGVADAQERDFASVTASLFALQQGVEIVRVHNVGGMKQAVDVWQALTNED